jgi:hypothetical protein
MRQPKHESVGRERVVTTLFRVRREFVDVVSLRGVHTVRGEESDK